ncbi:glycoside hydrolase family 57 protein [Guyparkeria sp. 1SP6A2]|nr:glycoside hydrolase family 57 protein [Guyparkeria sp. 1SP6A2]
MTAKMPVVFCWHMHQPEYRDPRDGVFQQPWTYLHAIKDYADMAAHLERWPEARAVINFVPILLEQLQDYVDQIEAFAESGDATALRDPLLVSLVHPEQIEGDERLRVTRALRRANRERLVERFPSFKRLEETAAAILETEHAAEYLSDGLLTDLSTWYHLAWSGETVRQSDELFESLLECKGGFSFDQRRSLLLRIGEVIKGLFGRYRRLAETGQVELSMTPYAHPIMPLLLDLRAGTESEPSAPQPQAEVYPEGETRIRWHIEHGQDVFRRFFGIAPTGCWPSEGAISDGTVRLLNEYGFAWAASGQEVLRNSLNHGRQTLHCQHQVFSRENQSLRLFFRDDGLSDRIGFNYQNWHADDAVADLCNHLVSIAESCEHLGVDAPMVSIILDGENAWEYYPDNGFWLLDGLYKTLSDHPRLEMTTFSSHLDGEPAAVPLKSLVAGSWVYGNLATWIGEPAKNRAWDLLVEARKTYLAAANEDSWNQRIRSRNSQQLAVCEGSDWFWWFGDDNPADAIRDFDRLFRLQLTRLYELIERPVPAALAEPLCEPVEDNADVAAGGVMRRGRSEA